MRPISSFLTARLAGWLAAGICVSAGILSWLGYRSIQEWRNSSVMLAERRSSEAADLLLEALTRDMRGVQETVLGSIQWNQFASDRPYEMSSLVASAFARYPYPESFLAWRADQTIDNLAFFNRSNRRPDWMAGDPEPSRFPVVIEQQASVAHLIFERIQADASRGRRVSVFEAVIGGGNYQIVAQLRYGDVFRERLSEIVGFTVNLPWAQAQYFADLTKQVGEIGGGAEKGLTLSVRDGLGHQVAGTPIKDGATLTNRRQFTLAFFNPDSLTEVPSDLAREPWMVEVSAANDPALSQAIRTANRMTLIGATSALALAIGLVLTTRAERRSAKLAELRADFVSTVTHELKTPIATIRAAAETLSQGRLSGIEAFQAYSRLVVSESKRLTRLVENLLAYSRITDVADIYAFEPLEVGILMKDLQQEFEAQLDEAGFDLQINLATDLRPVRGDRLALRLLFDNLIDNAVRYSADKRDLYLDARAEGHEIVIDVRDSGIGIATDEIAAVTRKFVRGKYAPSSGSGLGLAIASRIARDHGGGLSISSTLGEGTTVSVRLLAV